MSSWLFVSDIDGTLLHKKDPIPAEVVAAAEAFQAAGGILTLCTGRACVSTREIAKQLNIKVPCVLYGGAALYDFNTDSFLVTSPIPEEIFPLLERVLAEFPGVSVQVYTTERHYMVHSTPYVLEHGTPGEQELPPVPLGEVGGEVLKCIFSCPERATLDICQKEIFEESPFPFAYSSVHFAEVLAPGASKAVMMHTLADRLGVPKTHIFAAGDGMTDLPMLRASAVAFAPKNAPAPLTEAAAYVFPPAQEGGVKEAFAWAAARMRKAKNE